MRSIVLTHQAARDLDRLPVPAREAVQNGLTDYAVYGKGDIKKLA